MYKKSNLIGFSVAIVIVASLHILRSYIDLNKWVLNVLFIWGFLGLAVINILLFAIPLCSRLFNLENNRIKAKSKEQGDRKDEQELKDLLQGDSVVKSKMPSWAGIGVSICIGLIAGSIVGFILNRIIA